MADAAVSAPESRTAGGFRIEANSGELFVTKDQSGISVLWQRVATVLMLGWFAVMAVKNFDHYPFLLACLALIFVLALLRLFCVCTRNLHCTSERLEVIEIQRGKVRRTKMFTRSEVGRISFGTISYNRYSVSMGLIFTAAGVKQKILADLECPEAYTILKHLDRLGYDVEHDVGMPMMVEMALERRNSKWRLL
jgi:hypothetical protein